MSISRRQFLRAAGVAIALPPLESLARVRVWNLQTDLGDLDLTFEPSGTHGFEDLRRDAVVMHLRSGDVTVASLADVVRSKEAADRPRDRAALPGLRSLLSSTRGAGR